MAVSATMAVNLGTSASVDFVIDGTPITTFTYTYATRRVTAPAQVGTVTMSVLSFLDFLDQLRRWLLVSRIALPARPSLLREWLLRTEHKLTPEKVLMRGEVDITQIWTGDWKLSTGNVTLDPRGALDLTLDEFHYVFLGAHDRLGEHAHPV